MDAARCNGQPGVLYGDFGNCAAAEESALCEGVLARGWDVVVADEPLSLQALEAVGSGDGGPGVCINVAMAFGPTDKQDAGGTVANGQKPKGVVEGVFGKLRQAATVQTLQQLSAPRVPEEVVAERVLACLASACKSFDVRTVVPKSERLTSSPALLLKEAGDSYALELNPEHSLVKMLMESIAAGDKEAYTSQAMLLADLGAVSAGVRGVSEAKLTSRLLQLANRGGR